MGPGGRVDISIILSGRLKTGQWWSCQNRPTDLARDSVSSTSLPLIRQVHFTAPTARAAFENVTVIEEAVEHGGDGGTVTEELARKFAGQIFYLCTLTFPFVNLVRGSALGALES